MEFYHPEPFFINHFAGEDPFPEYSDSPRINLIQDTRIKNVVNSALSDLKPGHPVIISAEGECTSNAVKAAELIKNKFSTLHQVTKISEMRTEEIWKPFDEHLDSLKVTRTSPIIYILISIDPLKKRYDTGYQRHHSRDPKMTVTL